MIQFSCESQLLILVLERVAGGIKTALVRARSMRALQLNFAGAKDGPFFTMDTHHLCSFAETAEWTFSRYAVENELGVWGYLT